MILIKVMGQCSQILVEIKIINLDLLRIKYEEGLTIYSCSFSSINEDYNHL